MQRLTFNQFGKLLPLSPTIYAAFVPCSWECFCFSFLSEHVTEKFDWFKRIGIFFFFFFLKERRRLQFACQYALSIVNKLLWICIQLTLSLFFHSFICRCWISLLSCKYSFLETHSSKKNRHDVPIVYAQWFFFSFFFFLNKLGKEKTLQNMPTQLIDNAMHHAP